MKNATPTIIVIGIIVLGILAWNSIFIVDETERSIVLQLGKPVGEVRGPGLHLKWPLVQSVITYDYRILEYDAAPADTVTKDKKNLVVDNYARWRIVDPLKFYRTVNVISSGRARLDDIIYSELREELGKYDLIEIVASKRSEIMNEVTVKSNEILEKYGIHVVDVRIKRADLPPQNQKNIFNRMRAERNRQAKQYRSEGREEAQKITTNADRERTVMLAEAQRQSDVLHGEGDAEATRIYTRAMNRDPRFYEFVRSLDAYKKTLKKDTSVIMTPDNQFLKQFQ